ncbi:MAG TPA: hypothetical protein VIU93_13075 [Gallionellaceae bacterium]
MRSIAATCCLLLAAYSPLSYPHDSKHAESCSKEAENISDTKTRNAFLAACVKKVDMTTFQMEEKAEQCDQNALNMKLQGLKKDQYLEHCYLEGEAPSSPKAKPQPAK